MTPATAVVREPSTSAVHAGWICVGIGLLTAWFFPLAHVFFSIAIILSVVAMVTHQVRSGVLLLTGSLAGIGVCAIIFVCGVAAIVGGAFHAATKSPPAFTLGPVPTLTTNRAVAAMSTGHLVAQQGVVGGNGTNTFNIRSTTLDEVLDLLAEGKRDDEILTAIANRPLLSQFGASELTSLRAYGANEQLISNLRTRTTARTYVAPPAVAEFTTDLSRIDVSPPAMPTTRTVAPSAHMPAPVDYATRNRQVQGLKSQIDALDEQIRCIRDNPKDSRYWWHYSSLRFNGIDQVALDAYLKELDRQRNDLRRQKWALEGR